MSFRFSAAFLAALLLAGCAGSSVPAPQNATLNSVSQGTTASSGAQLAIPSVGGVTGGTLSLPTVTAGAGSGVTVQTLIGNAATHSVTRRSAESIANSSAFAEVVLTAEAPMTLTGSFVATITYAGGPAQYFTTFQDPAGNLSNSSQLTAANSVYIATSPSGTFTLAAGESVAFDFATSATSGASTGSGGATFSSSLSFITTGSAAAQTVTVLGATGTITATTENAAIATATVNGSKVTVTPTGAGTTAIDLGGSVTGKITLTVTTSPVTVN